MPTGGPLVTVQTWGDAVFASITNTLYTLLGAIPQIIGALLILAIGWVLSNALASLTRRLLGSAGADRLFSTHGTDVYGNVTRDWPPSRVTAEVVRWIVRLVFLNAAANVLGLTQISALLNQIVLWLPNLVVAAVVLMVAPLIGRFVRGAIEVGAGEMGFSNAGLLGQLAYFAILAMAVIIAINQIGIAANLVNTLFIGVVAALSIAFGLAFGLGGRDVAAQITQQWYASSQQTAQRIRDRAAQAARTTTTTTRRERAPSAQPSYAAVQRANPEVSGGG
jgi:hypothetical protein